MLQLVCDLSHTRVHCHHTLSASLTRERTNGNTRLYLEVHVMKVTVAARDRQHVAARIDVRRQRQRAVLRAASQVQSEAAELAHRRESSLERCAAPTPIDQPLGRSFGRSFTLEQSRANRASFTYQLGDTEHCERQGAPCRCSAARC